MPLNKEIKYFKKNLAKLLKHHKGKYALIKDDKFIGAYDTQEAAFSVGVEKFGVVPFLIKLITEEERSEQIPALTHGLINADL